jgi:hypothetical protein
MHSSLPQITKRKMRQNQIYVVVCTVCHASSHVWFVSCLGGDGEMRALQRESQFLFGERVVVVRLDRVVGTAQELIGRLAEVASVWVLDHGTRAREWVTLVRLHA